MSGAYSNVCLDDVGYCMLVATALGLAVVVEGNRVGRFAVWVVVMVAGAAAAAAVRNLLDTEVEDRAAGVVVLVDAVGSSAHRHSNHWLP